jgi:hypothetical protein
MPPARFERTAPGLGILCSILLSYGGLTEYFYLFAFYSVIIFNQLMRATSIIALLISCQFISGCGATNPLSITLHHPKTNAVRKCAARESTARDTEMLAGIVESCARQLEAHGFVRINDSFVPPSSAVKNTSITEESTRR